VTKRTTLLLVALGALTIGLIFYLSGREAGSVYFLNFWPTAGKPQSHALALPGGSLPTFIHIYAFILLTYWVVFPDRRGLPAICLGWMLLEGTFEWAQSEPIAVWLASHTPAWFTGVPLLENWSRYFLLGTFDPFDLLAVAVGGCAAYLTVEVITRSA